MRGPSLQIQTIYKQCKTYLQEKKDSAASREDAHALQSPAAGNATQSTATRKSQPVTASSNASERVADSRKSRATPKAMPLRSRQAASTACKAASTAAKSPAAVPKKSHVREVTLPQSEGAQRWSQPEQQRRQAALNAFGVSGNNSRKAAALPPAPSSSQPVQSAEPRPPTKALAHPPDAAPTAAAKSSGRENKNSGSVAAKAGDDTKRSSHRKAQTLHPDSAPGKPAVAAPNAQASLSAPSCSLPAKRRDHKLPFVFKHRDEMFPPHIVRARGISEEAVECLWQNYLKTMAGKTI